MQRNWRRQISLIGLLLFVTWLRLWQLPELPPGLWWDEAYNAMDALWMIDTLSPALFLIGNNGREPMFHYMAAVSMYFLGGTPFALRLVAALTGILTISLTYRWLMTLFAYHPDRHWLALFASAAFGFSVWHVVMSRAGYRAILIPPFFVLTASFFWLGWRKNSLGYFVASGIALGLSQYTYVLARLFPVVFGLFVIILSGMGSIRASRVSRSEIRILWRGLMMMVLGATVVFLPLAVFFFQDPPAFVSSTLAASDTDLQFNLDQLFRQFVASSIQVFVEGYDHNWRHGVVGSNGFGYISTIGFFIGLPYLVWHFRRPVHLFLLVSFIVFWLPVSFSDRVHSLRLSALMPVYYAVVALGYWTAARLVLSSRFSRRFKPNFRLLFFGTIIVVGGYLTAYDVFIRWAQEPDVYDEFNGLAADLAQSLVAESQQYDLLIPFSLYALPTIRLILHDQFKEQEIETSGNIYSERPMLFVEIPNDRQISSRIERVKDLSYVLLSRNAAGSGVAYVSRQSVIPAEWETFMQETQAQSFFDPHLGGAVASLYPMSSFEPFASLFNMWPEYHSISYKWDDNFLLKGYRLPQNPLLPGQTLIIEFFWQRPKLATWQYEISVEILNARGELLGRSTSYPEGNFRWRTNKMFKTQHFFYVGPEVSPGPYVMKLSLRDRRNGQVMPVTTSKGVRKEVVLGLFYVAKDEESDPRQPPVPIDALVAGNIELRGYAPPLPLSSNLFRGKLYWQTNEPVSQNYTPVVRLSDSEDTIISEWVSQPLVGHYPTSFWRPGETVVDEFDMTLPADVSSGSYRLVAGLVDSDTGEPLSAINTDGKPFSNGEILLEEITIPAK